MSTFAKILGTIAVLATVVGCSELDTVTAEPGVVRVEAPPGKCWSGAIADSTKDGCGAASFPIEGETIIVANAQKTTEGKWELVLVLEVGGSEVDRSSTTAEFGIAQVEEG